MPHYALINLVNDTRYPGRLPTRNGKHTNPWQIALLAEHEEIRESNPMNTQPHLIIHGAAGRMGQRLIALASDADTKIACGIDHANHPMQSKDLGQLAGIEPLNLTLQSDWPEGSTSADVVIDFSVPDGTLKAIEQCLMNRWPLVIGTTGLTEEHHARIGEASHQIPIIVASNFSRVVNVLWKLAGDAAKLLGEGYDIEVLEAHHRFKVDAPSGTALTLAKKLCEATNRDFDEHVKLARHGDDVPREPMDITVQSLRIGDDPGQHTAYFAGLGERLEIKHVSTSRDSYVTGALEAARWLVHQKPGQYTMTDVLGI